MIKRHYCPTVSDSEGVLQAGRVDWLDFVWLSHKKEQQRCVYEFIRDLGTLFFLSLPQRNRRAKCGDLLI